MTGLLLASGGWVLDLVFFLLIFLGMAWGAYKGFVAGICKLAGKWVSLIIAVVFCISFANFLELCFHMTSGIANGIAASIGKDGSAYAAAIPEGTSGAALNDVLAEMGIGGFQRWLIRSAFGKMEVVPVGATPAILLASVLAKWISVAIAFVLLIVLVRFGALFITKLFDAVKNKAAPVRIVDQALGAILGLCKALFLIFMLLLICNWLPINALQNYIASSTIVEKIYTSEWFQSATSYAVSGRWFNDYVKGWLSQ